MTEPKLKTRRRNLPHWAQDGSTYFVTFRLANGILTDDERGLVIDHLKSGDGSFYTLAAAVVMPDHVHLLLKPLPGYDLSRIMKGVNGVTAWKLNLQRQSTGTIWQDESWDRIIRDTTEFQEKLQYMADNPLKAGLARRIEDYPYWYCNMEFF